MLRRLPHSICLLRPCTREVFALGDAMEVSDFLLGMLVVALPAIFGLAWMVLRFDHCLIRLISP
jgi:hypothetical protein